MKFIVGPDGKVFIVMRPRTFGTWALLAGFGMGTWVLQLLTRIGSWIHACR